jgi:hypothetical protein
MQIVIAMQVMLPYEEPGYLSGIALGYGLDDGGFDFRQGLGIFLFITASRPALGPTLSPIQWVKGVLSLGVNRLGREADLSRPSSTEVKECLELYFHFPVRVDGVVMSRCHFDCMSYLVRVTCDDSHDILTLELT